MRVELRAVFLVITLRGSAFVLFNWFLGFSLCVGGVGVGLEMVGVRCESRSARLFLASLMASLSFCISNRLAHRCMKHNERARVAPLDFVLKIQFAQCAMEISSAYRSTSRILIFQSDFVPRKKSCS